MQTIPGIDAILHTAAEWSGLALATVSAGLARLAAVELPIPDLAILIAAALLIHAVRLNATGSAEQRVEDIRILYQAELLTANRRAQQARGEINLLKRAAESERQKRRREARGELRGRSARKPNVVKMPRQTASM